MIHEIITNLAKQMLIYGRNFILNSALQLPRCVCVCVWGGDWFARSIAIGRNLRPWGQANVQAMGYPIRENALRRSLTRYILHRPAVTQMSWHHLCFGVQTLPSPQLKKVGRKSALHHPVVRSASSRSRVWLRCFRGISGWALSRRRCICVYVFWTCPLLVIYLHS